VIEIDLTKPPPDSPYAHSTNNNNDFHFKVLLSNRFKVFPEAVGKEVLRSYTATFTNQMAHLKSNTAPPSPYRYSTISAQCIRPSSTFEYAVSSSNIHHASLANIDLLKHFLSLHSSKIRVSARTGAPEKFVHLETQESVMNPDFIHLHSVRYGEVGWGFDAGGCLSLYWVEMVERKNVIGVMFVERGVVKVEE
jgi:hypothetical protein